MKYVLKAKDSKFYFKNGGWTDDIFNAQSWSWYNPLRFLFILYVSHWYQPVEFRGLAKMKADFRVIDKMRFK